MSRMSAAFVLASVAAPAEAQLTAEQALSNYRGAFKPTPSLDCPKEEADIVVCGARPAERDPYRLPLPVGPEKGARIVGEAKSAVEVANEQDRCSTVGRNPQCGSIPLLAIGLYIATGVVKKIAEEIEYAEGE